MKTSRFPSCKYSGRRLKTNPYYEKSDEIPLLIQAKKHLEKSYPHLLNIHNDTIQDCIQLCRKIKEIINAQEKPSFENTIITRIKSDCPKLKITYDTNLRESNIYIAQYIFKTFFENQGHRKE